MDVSYINNSSQEKYVLKIDFNQFAANPKIFMEASGCAAEVRQCIFPFTFNDKEYTECTNDLLFESDDRTKESFWWCATSTNDNGSMKNGKWGRCDEATCNIVGAPTDTHTNAPTNAPTSKSSGGLSGGVIPGIITGIVVVLVAVGGVIFKVKYLTKIQ